jgi:small-conductance mechanosensitive channel
MESWFSPELVALIHELEQRGAYFALLLVAPAGPLAWGFVRMARGPNPKPHSIWFGRDIVDGVLFPLLWLGLTFAARVLCQHLHLPLAVFRLAIPILMSLVAIRLTVRVIRAVFPKSPVVRAIERTVSWAAWVAVVLWVTGVLPSLLDAMDDVKWKTHGGTITLLTVLEGVLSAGFVLVISLWISAALERRLLKDAQPAQLSWRKALANITRAALVGLLLALSAVGIDLTALSVFGGAIGVGLGFGLQKLASNYVSGFVILAERAVKIGDAVKVDGFEGKIVDIATRYTVVRADSGRQSIVPNELFIIQRVENASQADPRQSIETKVLVGFDTDLDVLLPQIIEVIRPVPRIIDAPAPSVWLSDFAQHGLELTITYWIADPANGTGGPKSDVNLALLRLFGRLGVEMPYPKQVVRNMETQPGPGAEGVIPGPAIGRSTTAAVGSDEGIRAGEAAGADPAPKASAGPSPSAPA